MKLKVGEKYIDENNIVVTITNEYSDLTGIPMYRGDNHTTYKENGEWFSSSADYPCDLKDKLGEDILEEKGASKNNKKDCKPDYALLPKAFMDQVAFVMMAGEHKYGRFNYCLGHEITQITAAQCRHAKLIEAGEDIDWDTTNRLREVYPDSPEITHLACIAAGSLMALHQKELGTLRDERYKKE